MSNIAIEGKLRGKRIFITEDDTMNRVVYTMTLKRSGVAITFDRWGRDTLTKLTGECPDLIILDLMLPSGLSGYDIFKEIREQPEFDHVPIVAISASEPNHAMLKCHQMGFSGFIVKPIEQDVLAGQILRLIEGEQVWYLGKRFGGEVVMDEYDSERGRSQ